MDTSMRTIQALYLRNYAVVNGKNEKIVEMNEILEFFEDISEKLDIIYITDIDGYAECTPHLDLLSEISDSIMLWVDAGSRCLEDVSDLLMAGVERVVLRPALLSPQELKEIWEETQSTICYLDQIQEQNAGVPRVDEVLPLLSGENREVIVKHAHLSEMYARYGPWLKNLSIYVDARELEHIPEQENRNIAGYIVEMDFDAV
jgi:uncharacterized protein related to proFAR isomerase